MLSSQSPDTAFHFPPYDSLSEDLHLALGCHCCCFMLLAEVGDFGYGFEGFWAGRTKRGGVGDEELAGPAKIPDGRFALDGRSGSCDIRCFFACKWGTRRGS
jgi:hypothetical protein